MSTTTHRFPYGKLIRGTYHYHRDVPHDLRPILGRDTIWKSLKTADPVEAHRLCAAIGKEHSTLFARLRAMTPAERLQHAAQQAGSNADHMTAAMFHLLPSLPRDTANAIKRAAYEAFGDDLHLSQALGRHLKAPTPALPSPVDLQAAFANPSLQGAVQAALDAHHRATVVMPPVMAALGLSGQPMAPRLTELCDMWLKDKPRAPETLRRLNTQLGRFLKAIGDVRIDAITKETVADYLGTLTHTRIGTRNLHRATLRALFEFAVEAGKIDSNPVNKRRLKDTRPARELRRACTPAELKEFIRNSTRKSRTQKIGRTTFQNAPDALLLMIYTGIRPGEACNIETGDVEEIDGVWVVHIRSNSHHTLKTEGKHTGERTIPLHAAIRDRIVERTRDTNGKPHPANELLFRGLTERALSDRFRTIRDYWTSARDDARCVLYSLRHTWAENARGIGMSDVVHRYLFGHVEQGSGRHYGTGTTPLKANSEWVEKLNPCNVPSGTDQAEFIKAMLGKW